MAQKHHFWLRHEVKEGEGRTPVLPEHCKKLIQNGHKVSVEKSTTRCVPDAKYAEVGCTLVPSETWKSAPKNAIILGLKELPENNEPIGHGHIYFAHCFKGQAGAKELLTRFKEGKGCLWDLEFLTHDNGKRVAAFGKAAGMVGMAVGLYTWAYQHLNPTSKKPCPPFTTRFQSYEDLAADVSSLLNKVKSSTGRWPRPIVIGYLGRSGSGSCEFAQKCGVEVTKWDMEETKAGGPFKEILAHDIFVNCIYLSSKIPPFITKELLSVSGRRMSVIVDVSCDPTNPNNPIPVYEQITTFLDPTERIIEGQNPVDVISIDHLPSLVPYESSKEFADSLIDHLLQFNNSPVWNRARDLFQQHLQKATKANL
jgi:saccharopine dehydrogenase (NAD+, L-lysine-forming)